MINIYNYKNVIFTFHFLSYLNLDVEFFISFIESFIKRGKEFVEEFILSCLTLL